MNILDLIEADGSTLRKVATTNGGEYAGACPWCGGRDRFRVWPEQDDGRFWCRGCDKSGDSIQYLREKRGLSFADACRYLDHDPGPRKDKPRPATWEPKEATAPGAAWQERARAFLDGAIGCLWSDRGAKMRAWLRDEKGLSDATIKKACLGLTLADKSEPRATWGLSPLLKEDGTERRLWLPGGLVIPWIVGGDVHRLRVRRSEPGDGARYVIVSGSSSVPMVLNPDRAAAVIVESELDGLLLTQAAGDLCSVVAMGTATAKPDRATHEALTRAVCILISLDTDTAGARAAWTFWSKQYGKRAKRWPTVQGKDASDAMANGLDLWAWIIAGLFGTEGLFERFCIQTIDGGLSDGEALREMMRVENG